MSWRLLLAAASALFVVLAVGVAAAHYAPKPADTFAYTESVDLGSGAGNYTGYTETTAITGSITVTAVAANGNDSASYANSNYYSNNQGTSDHWSSSGNFKFSSVTFLYTQGTDNQTGYTNPYVWFFMNNSLPAGSPFLLLNSQMTLVGTDPGYALNSAGQTYVKALFGEGNGSFQRNDVYGVFTATYNWKAYFDPSTGYVIGYLYTEHDSDGANGFTITDSLTVTSTSYALTAGTPPSNSGSPATTISTTVLIAIGLGVFLVVVVVIALLLRSRRRSRLPTHSPQGQVSFPPPPMGPPPPAVSLIPSGQPAVQQVVIKETVKTKCRYCGSLIDTTVENCPFCGAPRT